MWSGLVALTWRDSLGPTSVSPRFQPRRGWPRVPASRFLTGFAYPGRAIQPTASSPTRRESSSDVAEERSEPAGRKRSRQRWRSSYRELPAPRLRSRAAELRGVRRAHAGLAKKRMADKPMRTLFTFMLPLVEEEGCAAGLHLHFVVVLVSVHRADDAHVRFGCHERHLVGVV